MRGSYGPFPYSPIIRRPPLRWPNGARLAVWVIPNVEFFPLERLPDVMQWSMRDYGNRVGVFRLMQALDRYRIRATAALNSDVCVHHPEIVEEGLARGWEFMGHNRTNVQRLTAELVNPIETVGIGNRRAWLRLWGRGPGEGVTEPVETPEWSSSRTLTAAPPGARRAAR